jgi:hypothetical protein
MCYGKTTAAAMRCVPISVEAECRLDSARMDEIKIDEVLEFRERILCNVPMLGKECRLDQQHRLQQVLFPEGFRTIEKRIIEHKQSVYSSTC